MFGKARARDVRLGNVQHALRLIVFKREWLQAAALRQDWLLPAFVAECY